MNYLIKNKAWKINIDYNKEELLYLLIDRPSEITYCNNFIWRKNNKLHRDYDFPAIIYNDSEIVWYKKNHPYRLGFKPKRIMFSSRERF